MSVSRGFCHWPVTQHWGLLLTAPHYRRSKFPLKVVEDLRSSVQSGLASLPTREEVLEGVQVSPNSEATQNITIINS